MHTCTSAGATEKPERKSNSSSLLLSLRKLRFLPHTSKEVALNLPFIPINQGKPSRKLMFTEDLHAQLVDQFLWAKMDHF